MNKRIFVIFFFAALVNSSAIVLADMPMDVYGKDADFTTMERIMVPFHIAQIVISLMVSLYVFILIRHTGQLSTLIYLLIAMMLFAVSSIVSYLPHAGIIHDLYAQITRLALNTLSLILIAVTFNLSIRSFSRA